MKLFQNKFFLICLCVALVLSIVPSVFSLMGFGGLAKNIIGTVTFPVRWCVSVTVSGFEGIGAYFTSIDALKEENEQLKQEIEQMKDRVDQAILTEDENSRLRDYLGMKKKYPSFEMEEGRVINHSSGNYMTTFTLNKGSIHGIEVNMPVITMDGIVGQVTEVGMNWCMVSTIIETATSVGVYIPRSGVRGIVSGDYSMRYDGVCKIEYIDPDADIQIGDKVISDGMSSVYPAGLEIGYVTAVELNEYTRTPVATVKPSVDFSSLEWVMVITGYESFSEEDFEEE